MKYTFSFKTALDENYFVGTRYNHRDSVARTYALNVLLRVYLNADEAIVIARGAWFCIVFISQKNFVSGRNWKKCTKREFFSEIVSGKFVSNHDQWDGGIEKPEEQMMIIYYN